MNKTLTKGQLSVLIVCLVLIIDQIIKVWVKTHMFLYQSIHVTDWFQILFTENNGMAFGMEIIEKLFLTSFRIIVVCIIIWYITRLIRNGCRTGLIVCISLVVAGALGNIIDCVFYGQIFTQSTQAQLAEVVPIGSGYGQWFYGLVVDMFYFPIIDTHWPMWMPFVGGRHFVFFSPIFNFADASISCGIIALLLFYGKSFSKSIQTVEGQLKKKKG